MFKSGDIVKFIGKGNDPIMSRYLEYNKIYTVIMVGFKDMIVEGQGITQAEYMSHFILLKNDRKLKLEKLEKLYLY